MAAAAVAGEPGERLSFFLSLYHSLFKQIGSVITYVLLEKIFPMWDEYLPVFHCLIIYKSLIVNHFFKSNFKENQLLKWEWLFLVVCDG